MVGDGFHRAICEFDRFVACVVDAACGQCVLKTHEAESDRAVPVVGVLCFVRGVEINIDDVVEHSNCNLNGLFNLLDVEFAVRDMVAKVDAAQVANRGFVLARIQQNFGAKITTVDHTAVILRRTEVGGVFPGNPWVSRHEYPREQFPP